MKLASEINGLIFALSLAFTLVGAAQWLVGFRLTARNLPLAMAIACGILWLIQRLTAGA